MRRISERHDLTRGDNATAQTKQYVSSKIKGKRRTPFKGHLGRSAALAICDLIALLVLSNRAEQDHSD